MAKTPNFALQAIQSGFSEYLTEPISMHQLGKTLFKFEKRTPKKWISGICIKSYSDYQFVKFEDIIYLKADNNTTDLQLVNSKTVNAYKTLKHFEGILSYPFIRIHNSYIVNQHYISRIHTGNAVCYIKNTVTKLPFSKSYKSNIDIIISEFANGNYLEI